MLTGQIAWPEHEAGKGQSRCHPRGMEEDEQLHIQTKGLEENGLTLGAISELSHSVHSPRRLSGVGTKDCLRMTSFLVLLAKQALQ